MSEPWVGSYVDLAISLVRGKLQGGSALLAVALVKSPNMVLRNSWYKGAICIDSPLINQTSATAPGVRVSGVLMRYLYCFRWSLKDTLLTSGYHCDSQAFIVPEGESSGALYSVRISALNGDRSAVVVPPTPAFAIP